MPNFVQRWMLLAPALSLLTACAAVSSNPAAACPPLRDYSRDFQAKLANEVEAASADAAFPVAMQDYGLLRAQIKKSCHR